MAAIETLETLEALDNKTLREKCNQYGLPNIPITDTSRKLLIKRLVKAMEAEDKPTASSDKVEKPKSRRETVHVIKVNIEEDSVNVKQTPSKVKSASSNRRTIIDPTNATTNYENNFTLDEFVTQKRRSGRVTPLSQSNATVQSATKRKVNKMIEEDDNDEDYSNTVPVTIEKSSQEIQRQSREPSLSKSITVTTSYVRDSPTPQREIIEEIDLVGEDEEEEEEEDDEEEYEEDETEILEPEPVIEPTKFKYMSTSRTYNTSKPFVPSPDKTPYVYTSPRNINTNPISPRVSLSQASSSSPLPYESTATRRFTTGVYKDSADWENRTFVHHRPDKDEKLEKDLIDTPYLSKFAQRLSYLKAEPYSGTAPLSGGNSKQAEEILYRQSPSCLSPSRISARRGISQNESIGESFTKFLIALDRKYHLKKNFIIFAIIFAIILIYVLLF